jgi:hypothetical protein
MWEVKIELVEWKDLNVLITRNLNEGWELLSVAHSPNTKGLGHTARMNNNQFTCIYKRKR